MTAGSGDPGWSRGGFDLFANPSVVGVATADLFDEQACAAIVELVEATAWTPGTVVDAQNPGDDGPGATSGFVVDPLARDVDVQPIGLAPHEWPLRPLMTALARANDRFFRFDLATVALGDEPAFMRYRAGTRGGHYGRHLDLTARTSNRKLSYSLQLSDPATYDGGDLVFQHRGEPASRGQGSLTIFPSYLVHQVTPVTRGERLVLAGWLSGPAFR